jgi:hypothetical protein
MKAIVQEKYGSHDTLELLEIDRLAVQDDEDEVRKNLGFPRSMTRTFNAQ